MVVTGFYDANIPVIMIYPPQHHAVAITAGIGNIAVDRFDENFFSYSRDLIIRFGSDTVITFQDGTAFEGDVSELAHRKLVVIYDIATRSFPPQTTPLQVIVLFELASHPIFDISGMDIFGDDSGYTGIVPPIGILTSQDIHTMWKYNVDFENGNIIVDDAVLNAPKPFVTDDGYVMVPVAAVAEALGYQIAGEGAEIVIGRGASTFILGTDSYYYARMAPQELGAAPELHDGVLFVPLNFFGWVMPADVYVMDGNIYIKTLTFENN
jgi:hypothetical protein